MKKLFTLTTMSYKLMQAFLFIVLLVFAGCKEESQTSPVQYDPSKPVEVSDFIPKQGGGGEQLVIYGENFGNDTSIVHVFIGDKEATVIGVKNNAIYCLVPNKAYKGTIKVSVGAEQSNTTATADQIFAYQKMMVVTTLLGEEDERGNFEIKDGPFDDCGGLSHPSWLKFDPLNPNLLYVGQDGGDIRLINFEDSTVTTPITRGMGNWSRIRTIDFTLDGQHMIIANDQWDEAGIATSILSRANNFQDPQVLTSYRTCNGASIHPVTGELYFNAYEKGQFFRYDMQKYFAEGLQPKDYEELFKIQDNGWEFHIAMAPKGNYAYILVINKSYIMRTDYNWDTKEFMQPYVVCGKPRVTGWVDGVGTEARLNHPTQGVFVRNPDYAGKENQYDFYFTEQGNHDIRILTPEGKVTTFAGRGSPSMNSHVYGHVDGALRTEARFDRPQGLAYDSVNHVFYVGDWMNRCIRKIALEE